MKNWKEFKDTGLLFWINRSLHLFGWAIVLEVDDKTGEVSKAYPKKVDYRGFSGHTEEKGFERLEAYCKKHFKE